MAQPSAVPLISVTYSHGKFSITAVGIRNIGHNYHIKPLVADGGGVHACYLPS
jgi:hypothetical protein